MKNQEVFQDSEFEVLDPMNQLAFLHFTTAAPFTTFDGAPVTATTTFFSEQQCTTCGNSMKRKSPSSSSEPKPKKLIAQEEDEHHRHSSLGFTKIDLPISFPTTTTSNPPLSSPLLRRSFSDVYNKGCNSPPNSFTGSAAFLMNNPQSPENSAVNVVGFNATTTTTTPSSTRGTSPAILPSRTPMLRRSVSDPIPSASAAYPIPASWLNSGEMGVGFSLPVDSIKDDSLNSKNDLDSGAEEVSVERLGECLSINYKCPCGTGYQILVSGKHCYYKLL